MSFIEESKSIKISDNFTLYEVVRSNTAAKHQLQDQFAPTQEILDTLKRVIKHVVEPIRQAIGKPVTITSGYRSPSLNKLIGGAKRSDHSYGRAVDLQLHLPDGKTNNRLIFETVLKLDLDFRQMIWEFGDDHEPHWIHIAYHPEDNKRQILKAYKEGGRTRYAAFDMAQHGISDGSSSAEPQAPIDTDLSLALEANDKAEVTASSLNVRAGAGAGHDVIGKITKGTLVEIDDIQDGWAKIELLGIAGWVSSQYIAKDGDEGTVTASKLNIRDEPSTSGDKVAPPLINGTTVIIKAEQDGWYQVETKPMEGFISIEYLEKAGELDTDE